MPIDFVNVSTVKAATRTFTAPITTASAFDGVITALMDTETNPLAAVSYTNSAGETIAGVRKTSESYKATVEFFDAEGVVLGSMVLTAPSRTGLEDSVAEVLATEAFKTAYGATSADQNTAKNSWTVRLTVHDATGENYYVHLTREYMKVSSFEADAILARVEAWADTQTVLN